jgi:hypothetical protein
MQLIRSLMETSEWKNLSSAEVERLDDDGARAVFGFCRVGTLDDLTFDELVQKLGEPADVMEDINETDKTTVKWYIRSGDGTIATIYDYKSSDRYNGEMEMDLSMMHSDPEVLGKIKPRPRAVRLGISNVTSWSIGGDADIHFDSSKDRSIVHPAVMLIKKIFGEKASKSLYTKEVRRMFGE